MSPSKRKSNRNEMTISSDEDKTKKLHYKNKYYKSSDTSKRIEKNKKSKKARKSYSESSSESDGGYDSRKENKTARKHTKKSSRERYEKEKHSDKSKKTKHQDFDEKREKDKDIRTHKVNRHDVSQKEESQNSGKRKRSRSQDRQRYGKWTDAVDTEKETSSTIMYDNTETYKKSGKRMKKSKSTENHSKNKIKYDSYSEESDVGSHKIDKAKYKRTDKSGKHSRDQYIYEIYDGESDKNSPITSEAEYMKKDKSFDKRSQDKSKYDRYGRESDEDSCRMRRKMYEHSKSYEKHGDRKVASDQPDRSRSRLENVEERAKSPYRKDVYENRLQNNETTHKNRNFHSRKKMFQQPYEDLDDPDRKSEKSKIDDDTNNKYADKEGNSKKDDVEPLSKKEKIVNINMRTGGAYIPPARLRMMQENIKDKASEEYQRIAWEALKKSIIGMTNKVNGSNISEIVFELFKENIIRGRGVLARAIMQAQGSSVTFTRVYAALVAVINTKFPEIGELILKRLIIQYRRGFRRNDKTVCLTAARFLAHLLNQEVAHEVLILEILTHLLENPTEDSVEIAILTLKECGKKLTQLTARGMRAITQRVREVLHEGNIDARVRYMIEVFFAVQKDGFKDFEIITEELDLVEDSDKHTHFITLDEPLDNQEMLNVFKFDPNYVENEEKYKSVAKEILGDSDDEEGGESGEESDSEGEEDEKEKKDESQQIIDMTDTNIVCLRRKIYLTIQSSLGYEECAHKLLKLELKPGQILEMCYMILDCCAQQRTYEKLFGLLAQRFCQLNKIYVEPFTEIFENSYKTIHRLETNKLRNVAKFFAHLLYTDAISWNVLSIIKLNEEDTSSSSRIFIKILFQELCEYMGLPKLNERVKDVTLQEAFDGLFPRDDPHNTRFAINFFTSIGLGGLTDELREHLKNLPKNFSIPAVTEKKASSASSSASSSSTSSSSSSSSSSSDSE